MTYKTCHVDPNWCAYHPDEAAAELERLHLKLHKAEAREQALAAHVEWLEGLRRQVIAAIWDDSFELMDPTFFRDDKQPPKPATSLARRDARMRAEALECASDSCVPSGSHRSMHANAVWLRARADEYRRQAEEGSQ